MRSGILMHHHSWKLLDVCIYTVVEVEKYQYLGTS